MCARTPEPMMPQNAQEQLKMVQQPPVNTCAPQRTPQMWPGNIAAHTKYPPPFSVHWHLGTTTQCPPLLTTACWLAVHTGTPGSLAHHTCTNDVHTTSYIVCQHSLLGISIDDHYSICNWLAPIIQHLSTFSIHWHLQMHHSAFTAIWHLSHTTMMVHLDALTRYINNCLEMIQHSKCMLDMHHSFISSPDIPFENSVIEGEYILLHFHSLPTYLLVWGGVL